MAKEKEEIKHYSLLPIMKVKSHYKVIYGERSNGKTFAVKHLGLFGLHEDGIDYNGYLDNGDQLAIVRRWDTDLRGKKGSSLFDDIIHNKEKGNILSKKTKGKWNSIWFQSMRWYLQKVDEDGDVVQRDPTPFAIGFALNTEEHEKSLSYPNIGSILFDEFISRNAYIPDEFISFSSIISTIVRLRDDITIFMCGNAINVYNPYFTEMGLKRVKTQKKGTIDTYKYTQHYEDEQGNIVPCELVVAVEYSDFPSKKKASNVYFAFDNPKLQMVTTGKWELALYPHLPRKYRPMDIAFTYFIIFDEEILQCEIICFDDCSFTYIHRRSKPLAEDDERLIYQQNYSPLPNRTRKIIHAHNKLEQKVVEYFQKEKVFYQDNEVGEMVNQYINWCRQN